MSSIVDSTEYVIRTGFEVSQSIPGLDGVERRLGQVSGLVTGIGRTLRDALGGALLGAGAGAGLGYVTGQVVGLHSEVQNAELGIGSLVNALTRTDMTTSLRAAKSVIGDLRKDAAAGAGELADYTQGFQTILGPAMRAGADLERTRRLNQLALTAGFALRGQEGLRLAPMDIVQALTAGASDRTTPIVSQALQAIGKTNEQFNKLNPAERLKVLEQAFGTFGEAAEVMGKSWEAQTATLRDNVKELAREVTQPLFEKWSEQLERANNWLERNRSKLKEMAELAGVGLGMAYDGAVGRAGSLATGGTGLALAGGAARLGVGVVGAAGGAVGGGLLALLAGAVGGIGASMMAAAQKYPETLKQVQKFTGMFLDSLTQFGDALLRIFDNPWVAWLGNGFLTWTWGFLGVLSIFVRGLTAVVDLVNDKASAAFSMFKALDALASGRIDLAKGYKELARVQWQNADNAFIARMRRLLDEPRPKVVKGTGPGGDDMPVAGTINNFNGPVNVTIKAERLDDPNTVLSSWEQMFRRVAEFPTGSAAGRLVPKPQ